MIKRKLAVGLNATFAAKGGGNHEKNKDRRHDAGLSVCRLRNAAAAKVISINFGSGEASLGSSDETGLAAVANWQNLSDYGSENNYPSTSVAFTFSDSDGTAYPEMALALCSGGNTYRCGATDTATGKMLYGYLDNHNRTPSCNAGIKIEKMSTFASRYSVYLYFNHDASDGTSPAFPA